ncbi:hypothetical protein AB0756_39740 [Tolypothrix campylonemoides VB511288_2]|uniref:Uncharacterized protein n=2 Tax=Tolypothrix TaxID=111782 RepID=A0A0C1QLI4_9CYAN
MDELKTKIKEYGRIAASLSRQARSIPVEPKENRKRKLDLMRQATEASKQCQALIQELKRQQVS